MDTETVIHSVNTGWMWEARTMLNTDDKAAKAGDSILREAAVERKCQTCGRWMQYSVVTAPFIEGGTLGLSPGYSGGGSSGSGDHSGRTKLLQRNEHCTGSVRAQWTGWSGTPWHCGKELCRWGPNLERSSLWLCIWTVMLSVYCWGSGEM